MRVETVSVLDRNEDSSVFYLVQSLRDGVTLFGPSLRWELPHSIRTKSLSEPYFKFLRDEVTLWVGCGPQSTLDHERRILLEVSPSSFRMGSPC